MSENLTISEVVIEVTRRCNMACIHCLRGDAEPIDINIKYVDALFKQIGRIGTLTITGGEPSLKPDLITEIIESAKKHNVEIGNFYCVTNGKISSKAFTLAMMELFLYCDDNEMSGVQMSTDKFHEDRAKHNMLSALSFFSTRGDLETRYLIPEGRAQGLPTSRSYLEPDTFTKTFWGDEITVNEGTFYLNAKGEIVPGCDWSFESQEEQKIGHIESMDLIEWARSLEEE